jgi:hypothetical protein
MDETMMQPASMPVALDEDGSAEGFLVDYINTAPELQQFQPQRLASYSAVQRPYPQP